MKPDKPKPPKKPKQMKQWQVEELMGVNDPTYHRAKGGALKQKWWISVWLEKRRCGRMSMRKLMYEYKQTLRDLKAAYEVADPDGDKPIIGGMIRDMEYAIRWMETGRDPSRMHMDADYSRVYYYSPFVLDKIGKTLYPQEWNDNLENDERVSNFLGACLTKREEDVYRLYIGEGLSMAKIGELLHIAKTSVQNLIERAEMKVCAEKEQVRLF
ncbi:hypothetical protein NIE88_21645 [Sporolactobacillus shoreicorticis]|uniref:Uncharacterized protein n=1 Tax=Sporolactobacillus shoreicorticis TaxID=1923877 RepID=A0ABW5RZJ5_9BACL|nr:hypothetical protein [Sporolactobacillus shoreicorticis]MCO7128333.1 hypothetical protein [Sporolactobacillus shoreicorticis]